MRAEVIQRITSRLLWFTVAVLAVPMVVGIVYLERRFWAFGVAAGVAAAASADQAYAIANDLPEVDPEAIDWLPLGVFALTQKDGSVEDATLYLQLAISKEGIIAGTFQNTATGKTFEVEGTIDEKSQRAAWGPVGESWPIMETGIYNLTENEAGALLHFESGETQQWTLVRLDEREGTQEE